MNAQRTPNGRKRGYTSITDCEPGRSFGPVIEEARELRGKHGKRPAHTECAFQAAWLCSSRRMHYGCSLPWRSKGEIPKSDGELANALPREKPTREEREG